MLVQDLGVAYEYVFPARKEGRFNKGLEGEAFFIYASWLGKIANGSQLLNQELFVPLASRGWHAGLYSTLDVTSPEKLDKFRCYFRAGIFYRRHSKLGYELLSAYDTGRDFTAARGDVRGLRATLHFSSGLSKIGQVEGYIGASLRRVRFIYAYNYSVPYASQPWDLDVLRWAPHIGFRWVFNMNEQSSK